MRSLTVTTPSVSSMIILKSSASIPAGGLAVISPVASSNKIQFGISLPFSKTNLILSKLGSKIFSNLKIKSLLKSLDSD